MRDRHALRRQCGDDRCVSIRSRFSCPKAHPPWRRRRQHPDRPHGATGSSSATARAPCRDRPASRRKIGDCIKAIRKLQFDEKRRADIRQRAGRPAKSRVRRRLRPETSTLTRRRDVEFSHGRPTRGNQVWLVPQRQIYGLGTQTASWEASLDCRDATTFLPMQAASRSVSCGEGFDRRLRKGGNGYDESPASHAAGARTSFFATTTDRLYLGYGSARASRPRSGFRPQPCSGPHHAGSRAML